MKCIVIIAEENKSRRLLVNILSAGGSKVFGADSIDEGMRLITVNCPDIVILDPANMMNDGITFIKQLKEWSESRIIAVSSAIPERHRIKILDSGADDYIEKPLAPGELLARVRVCLRHIDELKAASGMNQEEIFRSGTLTVDFNRCCVKVKEKQIHLTKNEFLILSLLCRYPQRVLTYDFIMKSVWGPQINENTGILRVNIANIRRKIEIGGQRFIHTENGIGYRIIEN